MAECVFCRIVNRSGPASYRAKRVAEWDDAVAFVPLMPVVDGHVLVVPRRHVRDASEDPQVTGAAFARAAELASRGACNLITSCGAEATQSVFHLHVHVVPRREGDGLALPWTGQVRVRQAG